MVAHAYNPSPWERETELSTNQGHPGYTMILRTALATETLVSENKNK